MRKIFTLEELEKYKGEDDADRHEGKVIFAIRDTKEIKNATKYNVYDVTKYLEDHPGGDDIMKENSGMDASDKWWNIGHSKEAMVKMKEYIIGQLTDFDCAMLKATTTTKLKIREDGYDNDMIKKKFDDYLFIKKNGDLVNLKKKDINNYDIKEIINFDADNYDFKKEIKFNKFDIWNKNENRYNINEVESGYGILSKSENKLNINYYNLKQIIIKIFDSIKDEKNKNKNILKKLKYICNKTLFFFAMFYDYNKYEDNIKIKDFEDRIDDFIKIDYDFNYIMEGNNWKGVLCDTYTVLDYLISDYYLSDVIEYKVKNLKYILKFLNIIKENNIKLDDKIYYHFFYKFYKNFEDFDIFALKNRWDSININNEIAQKFISDYKKIFKNIFNILSKKISLFKSYEQLGIDNKYCFREKYPIETLIISNTFKIMESSLITDVKFLNYIKENINNFVELIFFKTLKNILKYFNTFVEYYWDYAYGLLLYDDKKRELEGYKWDDLKKTFNYVDVNHLNIKNKDKEKYSDETIISTINIIGPPPIEPEESDTTKYNNYKELRDDYDAKRIKNKKVWTKEIHNYVVLENEDTYDKLYKYNVGLRNAFQKIINEEKLFETYDIFANIDIYENKKFIEIMEQNIKQEKFIEIMKQNIKDLTGIYFNNNEEQTDYFINLLIKKIINDYKDIED